MTKIEIECELWQEMGFRAVIVNAPHDAVTFDKMLVVFSENRKSIKLVSFFNTITNKFVATF